MAIPVHCAGCGTTMKVADQHVGKKGKCPKCGGSVQVPKIAQTLSARQPVAAKLPQAKPRVATPIPSRPVNPTPSHQSSSISFSSSNIDFRIKKNSSLPPPWVWVAGSGSAAIVVLLVIGFMRDGAPTASTATPNSVATTPVENPTYVDSASLFAPDVDMPRQEHPLVRVSGTVDSPGNQSNGIHSNNFEDVAKSIVKFEMPLPGGGMATGTGFLIDRRGWIATNHHVVSMASTAARAKLYSGRKVEIEGIVDVSPEGDLAIVKLRDFPKDIQPLDISCWAAPKVGSRVYAFGNPLYNEFSLVEGIVSRVLTTAEFAAQQPDSVNVLTELKSPPDRLWIQTDAKVSQGNSGGPLLDEKCRVIGVNTFANLDAQFGFASHVRYLKGLADAASDEVTPLKSLSEIRLPDRRRLDSRPDDSRELALNKETLRKVYDSVATFDWKPTNREEYRKMADLALILTACREPSNKNIPFGLSDLVDTLFSRMKQFPWTEEHFNAINRQAKHNVATGRGVVLVGTFLATVSADGTTCLLVKVPGFSELFMMPLDENTLTPTQGTRLMIFGVTEPRIYDARFSKNQKVKVWKIRSIKTHHTLGV